MVMVRVVINYDFPTGVEDYVHRIGRTGRAGATGVAYTFFCDQDAKHASDLVKVLEGANQNVPVELRNMASRGGGMGRARRQWGSGPGGRDGGRGGRYDSSYNGRDGGRTGWGMSSIPAKGVNRGYERDRHGSGTCDGQDTIASGSFHYKSFHESMTATAKNRGRSRSRSRSPNKNSGWGERRGKTRSRSRSRSKSPYRNSGWGDKHGKTRSRSRSRSSERFNGAAPTRRSFHESATRASSYGNPNSKDYKNYDNLQVADREKSLSPRVNEKEIVRGSNNSAAEARRRSPPRQSTGYANGSNSNFRDEEEDGMLPPEDNGLFRPPN
ncbi:UNVERIFIED_CONTAM: ATP-dependent RNA helicase-like protein DB10 [Sesamum latifolium]|uniref:ATP-dependent RNA helicase-like protein DB10 n=1 Tax=Sesamum latifolium TaxID=2727402 RepID=A0AAW2XAK2_9LAMI